MTEKRQTSQGYIIRILHFFFLFKHILFSTFSPRARLIEGDHVVLFKTLEYSRV
jgi:hypothetical protein